MTNDICDRNKNAGCFLFIGNKLLLLACESGRVSVPMDADLPDGLAAGLDFHEVVLPAGGMALTADLPDGYEPESPRWVAMGLRDAYPLMDEDEYVSAGKAWQILFWHRHSRFCPACGAAVVQHTPIMKRCPQCGYEMYPVVSPAIIVRITRGDEILLVHARNFRGRFFGLVAGFVESGESFEQCVCREVMEETGLTVKNLRYFGSQTWPYPSNVMVGFTAEYESGQLKLQADELSAGQFFSRDNLPELPRKPSIARRLIEDWLGDCAECRH